MEDTPIERVSLPMLLRLLELRPDLQRAITTELKRRGVQVVQDTKAAHD